jgi:hypothetical protein
LHLLQGLSSWSSKKGENMNAYPKKRLLKGNEPMDELKADEKRSFEDLKWLFIWLCVVFVIVCTFSYAARQAELKGCMECEVKK